MWSQVSGLTVSVCPPIFKKNLDSQAVVVPTFNPNTWGAETGGCLESSRSAWSTEQYLGTGRANDVTVSTTNKQNKTTTAIKKKQN